MLIASLFKWGVTVNVRKYEKRPTKWRSLVAKCCHGVIWFFNLILAPIMSLMFWIVQLGEKDEAKLESPKD